MAGYTTITVKGQEIGLRFALRAIKRIQFKLKEVMADSSSDEHDKSILVIRDRIYSGYLCDCMYKDIEPTVPVQDFTEYVENANMDSVRAIRNNTEEPKEATELVRVFKVYQESLDALPKVEDPEEEKKNPIAPIKTKKQTGTKSKSFVKEETGTLIKSHGVSLSFSEEPMIGNGQNS